ncbi:TetR/AcrR family transcriptional regulator [Arsenicicoccus sp. oral taxon 190]|uniref:TetR/AcrR family transcriptional regulator n=1 Tax=Arsenicicoccus sp. oral taxon 190 TaxID=1658671 RepID=UPI00067ABF82|nr:TetR family transcriptional regulator [Arsenicicoccus sp. oral taxon 190]
MVANPARRAAVLDAALEVLGRDGARAVTHRAVDVEADLPAGTTANYFPSRADLLTGMASRIFALLAPAEDRLADLERLPSDHAGPEYAAYVVERLLARPTLARALLELRLEASRNPSVAEPLTTFLRDGLDADVAFHTDRGLPGGRDHVIRLHHLVNGILLDALTVPLAPERDPLDEVRLAATALGGGS